MKTKTKPVKKATIRTIVVECPHCKELIEYDAGVFVRTLGEERECNACDGRYRTTTDHTN